MQRIDKSDLKHMNEQEHDDFVLINVLSPEAFNERHIRTSINLPVGDERFTDLVEKVAGDKSRKIVLYCANSECDASPKAARRLEDAGFTRVFDYEGGTADWFADRAA